MTGMSDHCTTVVLIKRLAAPPGSLFCKGGNKCASAAGALSKDVDGGDVRSKGASVKSRTLGRSSA